MTPSQLAEMHSLADFPVPSRIKHLFDKTPAAAESAANAECVTVTTGDGTDTTPAVSRKIHTESFIIFIVIAFWRLRKFSAKFFYKSIWCSFLAVIFQKRPPAVGKIASENGRFFIKVPVFSAKI
jgi:hypothetical protein